jgi:predicted amidohydrolase
VHRHDAVMKVALCQLRPAHGDPVGSTDIVLATMESVDADLFIFPEMFLTDYTFTDLRSVRPKIDTCLDRIRNAASGSGKCAVVGGPFYEGNEVYNAAYVFTTHVDYYKKNHLAHFGPFSERDIFKEADEPFMLRYGGLYFGLTICYDLFFPELWKGYAMENADAIICISASPMSSETAFDRVLPARSVEDTVYTLFVNNTGSRDGTEFFGRSRCISPRGDTLSVARRDECIVVADIDATDVEYARCSRPTLADTRVKESRRHLQNQTF